MLDINSIREDFPILKTIVRGKQLVYLDNAATTQKPKPVIEKINYYYSNINSNIHRGIHYLSQIATDEYEASRIKIQKFINAKYSEEIIFTKGTTESLNLVASSFGKAFINEDDEIVISAMEHHSNIVPWQLLCQDRKAKLKVIPIDDNGEIILEEYEKLLNEKTKIVAVVHISNSLGTINPIEKIIEIAHKKQIPVVIDGAQSVQHIKIDVQKLDCDFFAFSGHKIYGPTGIGVLYGKRDLLNRIPPYQGGGDMIRSVSFERTIFNDLPHKFEGGTPNIVGAIALGTAIDYVRSIGFDKLEEYEKKLLNYATNAMEKITGLNIIGKAKYKAGAISFILDGIHPHDVGTFLDMDGIAIRTGHHCTEPVMRRFNIPATSRASFAFYNTFEEIDKLISSLKNVIETFS